MEPKVVYDFTSLELYRKRKRSPERTAHSSKTSVSSDRSAMHRIQPSAATNLSPVQQSTKAKAPVLCPPPHSADEDDLSDYCPQLTLITTGLFPVDRADRLEMQFVKLFEESDAIQDHYIYFLMDPLIAKDLRLEANQASDDKKRTFFPRFTKSIFYIGCAKLTYLNRSGRIAAHMFCAADPRRKKSSKDNRIISIWREDEAVIAVRIFRGMSRAKGLARESICHETIDISNMTNRKWDKWDGIPAKGDRLVLGASMANEAFLTYLWTGGQHYSAPIGWVPEE